MAKKRTYDARVKEEKKRLINIFAATSPEMQEVAAGIIDASANLRIMIEDCQKDIKENGMTEPFSQSDKTEPYMRKRPIAELYNQFIKNYAGNIKMLKDMLPDDTARSLDDGFDDFLKPGG